MDRMIPDERFWLTVIQESKAPLGTQRRFSRPDGRGYVELRPESPASMASMGREMAFWEAAEAGHFTDMAAPFRGIEPPGGAAARRLAPTPAPAPRKETAMVATAPKDQDAIWKEIQAASQGFAGDTPETRVAGYIEAHPERYREYRDAPRVTNPPPKRPAPLTAAEAQRAFTANPTRDAAWGVIEAKARAYAETHQVTQQAAVVAVVEREPELYRAYSRGTR